MTFNLFFALYGSLNIGVLFIVNQFGQSISGAEASVQVHSMLSDAICKVGCYAGVEHRVICIGDYIDPTFFHTPKICSLLQ